MMHAVLTEAGIPHQLGIKQQLGILCLVPHVRQQALPVAVHGTCYLATSTCPCREVDAEAKRVLEAVGFGEAMLGQKVRPCGWGWSIVNSAL